MGRYVQYREVDEFVSGVFADEDDAPVKVIMQHRVSGR